MAKTAKVDLIAALHEALLSVPTDTFTMTQAREALVDTFLHKDNMTGALRSMIENRVLEEAGRGRFKFAADEGGGLSLRRAIRDALCQKPGKSIDIKELQKRIRKLKRLMYDPTPDDIKETAQQISDWVKVDGDKYTSVKCPVA